jgi:hypothetical protein
VAASNPKAASNDGFSLARVFIKVSILVVSMVSTAIFLARISPDSGRSREWNLAGKLAAEKIEELKRLPADDPRLAVTDGRMAGCLTSDVSHVFGAGLDKSMVKYYDEIVAGEGGASAGADSRTTGKPTFRNATPKRGTTFGVTTNSNGPAPTAFNRRWLIQKDVPVAGVKRVTVVVSLEGGGRKPPLTYQLSAVCPSGDLPSNRSSALETFNK